MSNVSTSWKRPDEFMKLQRKKQLVARLNKNNNNNGSNQQTPHISEADKTSLLEAKIAQKRKNPFAKNTQEPKKIKANETAASDSLLSLIETVPAREAVTAVKEPTKEIKTGAKLVLQPFDAQKFSKLLQAPSALTQEDEAALQQQKFSKNLPMDWSLKTRLRVFCSSELPATTLKTSQLASGLTSFARCIDTKENCNSSLDISPSTRLNQATYYWQHPHLPWLTLFPRNSKNNTGLTLGDRERKALADDWDHSFQGLFQLLRARQCPYFYVCANTFTVLFRAAGTGGLVETHAMMVPSTRGLRAVLRQEGIEYTMPLKKDNALNRSADSAFSEESNSLTTTSTDNMSKDNDTQSAVDDDEDTEEEEEWLESLGVDEREIRKIKTSHTRKVKAQEMTDDFSDNSLLLFEGVECQGFFSYLLNAKSTITSVGRLAGVPPTLLSPVAFPRATVQHLSVRSSKVRMDDANYSCIDMKGIVMPTVLPYVCELLGEWKDVYSAAMASNLGTLAFSKATQKLLEEPKKMCKMNGNDDDDEDLNCGDETTGHVFSQENLSDCGLLPSVIECICRRGQNAVGLLERVCYDKEHGFAWS